MKIRSNLIILVLLLVVSIRVDAQLTNLVKITPSLDFWLWRPPNTANAITTIPTDIDHFEFDEEIWYANNTTMTQRQVFARIPKDQSFVINLYDNAGKKMPKTEIGIKNSNPVDIDGSYGLRIKHDPLISKHPVANILLKPSEYFIISNRGVYFLEVQMRVWTENTNRQIGVVTSPPVRVQIEKK